MTTTNTMNPPSYTTLYHTQYRGASNTKSARISVYYDLMPRAVRTVGWEYGMQPRDNHRAAVLAHLNSMGLPYAILAEGEARAGYWFAVRIG